ncbi:unnamed protein product [Brassica oleracea]|uniref:(rape) hypothetical protein n=1 Tax=Brassica napus TaxID=3708 RepID=A0A816L1U6_BRANA|nr:unnamed protein product [Brassica napus]
MGSLKKEGEREQMGDEFMEAILYVNGVRKVLPDGLAHMTLLEYLRGLGLTGTKLGCGEGGCGACTVMVSNYDRTSNKCVFLLITLNCRHYAVNACLAPLYSVEGMHVISIEGVGHRKHGLHPLQTPAETSCLCLWNFVVETKHCA